MSDSTIRVGIIGTGSRGITCIDPLLAVGLLSLRTSSFASGDCFAHPEFRS